MNKGMRDDLIGIALAVIGVVLFIAVILPGDAVLSSAISMGLRHAFGLGAFVIPIAFVIWGASYFFKAEDVSVLRLIAGIAIIVVAIMCLLSLFRVGMDPETVDILFSDDVLINGGGYVGSGITWLLMSLLGGPIACIIEIALIISGLVIAGLSISTPFLLVKNFIFQPSDDDAEVEAEFYEGTSGHRNDYDFNDPAYMPETDETIALGNKRRARLTSRASKSSDATVVLGDDLGADRTIDLTSASFEDGAQDIFATQKTQVVPKKESKRRGSTVTKPAKKLGSEVPTGSTPSAMEGFKLPEMGILHANTDRRDAGASELKATASQLQQTLEEFGVPARVVGWLAGPTVTMFKVELPSGVRLARLVNLADDIALALAASGVRIAQIPNTSLVGVEIPNKTRSNVLLGDIISATKPGPLMMCIGEDVDGEKISVNLAKMPHLLVAGTTGSGKSVAINSMIMTILMRATPAEVRMILIDPKRVEFSLYNSIPHLYVPVVTEPKEAASALRWGVAEMERRLKIFEQVGARNIGLYNEMIQKGQLTDDNGDHPEEMPFIVIVIDELSDLMMVAGKDVEDSIVRISQLARAAGIHLIIATQRPSSNVVTGMIKANITNRIGLLVATSVDSRVILDQSGAEKLVGNGDMLFSKPEWGKPKRIQGCYVDESEIAAVVEHLKQQGAPDYHLEVLQQQVQGNGSSGASNGAADTSDDDPLIWDAAEAVVNAGLGSTSMLQRRLKVGYARAGRIMDTLEAKGIVGPPDGSRARDVLIDSVEDLEAIKAFEAQDREGL